MTLRVSTATAGLFCVIADTDAGAGDVYGVRVRLVECRAC